ncbi:MAG TPA: chalcone isomerase family protein [Noviherbaspirillum sp.]|uniref:chalcone isomerase family protein n=1 Tax=Noviherbaspirillum sp. TaxID=1926288 RepID=UPI002D458ABC|nr:chalcone isomerase family protein [Noviherbaspirillum sp.]HYD94334.1 chalcone isomerase family protein [Noviherbaspirillum sp.]
MKLGIRLSRALGLVGVTAALFLGAPAGAAEVAGVKLDEAVRIANQDLKLNGAGIRYKAIFKVYVAGLYLPEKKSTVADVLNATGPRRVSIVLLRDISNEELGRGFMSGIQQNLDRTEKSKIIMQLQKFGEIFASIPEAKKGDVLTVDWLPGSGTVIQLNGKRISDVLPDIAFYNAILKIWLGDKPIDTRLKPAMLGEKPEEMPRGNV